MNRKLILIIAIILMIIGGTSVAFAETVGNGKCGNNISWELSSEGMLTLTGSGTMYDYQIHNGENTPPWYRNAYDIKQIDISEGITSIGAFAFYDCKNATQLIIPDSVTIIGTSAFKKAGFEELKLSRYIKLIGEQAFYDCPNLKKVDIEDLKSYLNIPECYYVMSNPFYNGSDLYVNGELVTELIIPDGVEYIKSSAFYGCTSLESIIIPASVKSIGTHAFEKCKNVKVVTFEGQTETGSASFSSCSNLETISAPLMEYPDLVNFSGFMLKSSKVGTKTATITWTHFPNAKKYIVVTSDGQKIEINDPEITTCKIQTAEGQNRNTITCTVEVYYDDGISPGYKTAKSLRSQIYFKPSKVKVYKLSTGSKYIKASWKFVNSDGYQVQISTNKNFTKNKKTYTIDQPKKLNKKISKLNKGKKYYIRVRAYREKYGENNQGDRILLGKVYGSWSDIKSIKCN